MRLLRILFLSYSAKVNQFSVSYWVYVDIASWRNQKEPDLKGVGSKIRPSYDVTRPRKFHLNPFAELSGWLFRMSFWVIYVDTWEGGLIVRPRPFGVPGNIRWYVKTALGYDLLILNCLTLIGKGVHGPGISSLSRWQKQGIGFYHLRVAFLGPTLGGAIL